jgi:hypothetical protein
LFALRKVFLKLPKMMKIYTSLIANEKNRIHHFNSIPHVFSDKHKCACINLEKRMLVQNKYYDL